MTASRTDSKRWIAPGFALVALTGLALIADHRPAPVLINESASLPRGVYVRLPRAAPARDTVVAVPQPSAVRAYLGELGMPGDLLLIKRVAAVGGDTVCRRDDRLVTPVRAVVVQDRDRAGSPCRHCAGAAGSTRKNCSCSAIRRRASTAAILVRSLAPG